MSPTEGSTQRSGRARSWARPRGARADLLVGLALGVLVLGPSLLPGYVLRGDMVFVPSQPWKPEWLGLDGGYPRAVPMDALVSWASLLLPGWVVQKVLLLGMLVGGAVGAGRLVGTRPGYARAAAMVLFTWNPWVAERLLIGQWALVLGYAFLPWVVLAVLRCADGGLRHWGWLVLALAGPVAASPSSGLMGVLAAVTVALGLRAWWVAGAALGAGAALNLCWIVPGLLADARPAAGASVVAGQFEAFAAQAESGLGVLASLLSGGGIWKQSVVPAERTVALVVLLSVALTVVGLLGWRWASVRERRLLPGLALLAAMSLGLAWSPTFAPVAEALDRASVDRGWLGILRDSHRYLAPAYLLLLPGVAALTEHVARAARPGLESLRLVAGLVVVAPVLLLPSLAWGALGELRAVDYPPGWDEVAERIAEAPEATTVVLPWRGAYRGFAFNDFRAQLDAAPRYLPGPVLVDDRVLLGEQQLPGESVRAARVTQALAAAEPVRALHELGVRWVLVEGPPPAADSGISRDLGRVATLVVNRDELQLFDLGKAPPDTRQRSEFVVLVDLTILILLSFAAFRAVRPKGYGASHI